MKPPAAIVMNMFYTGLGIARSLGERGIPVIGLASKKGIYGDATRYAKTLLCPDSRTDPEALLPHMIRLGKQIGHGVVFPTRDDDVVFLDRYRQELSRYFELVIPGTEVVSACLNKWETHHWARKAGVAAPKCWLIEEDGDFHRILDEVTYPCVLKPLSSFHWHRAENWKLVGGRKAVGVASREELLTEYKAISRADARMLIEEMVPGPDNSLVIAACYLDRNSEWVAGFTARKLVQTPEGFGTGCILQTVDKRELFGPTLRLLKGMRFTGIAEVEYKWNAAKGEYQLIEINCRPWDQHRLGNACGVDLVYAAYCERAGLPTPAFPDGAVKECKWVAEDVLLLALMQLAWKRDPKFSKWLRLLGGRRVYGIWSWKDPLPSLLYFGASYLPGLAQTTAKVLWNEMRKRIPGQTVPAQEGSRP